MNSVPSPDIQLVAIDLDGTLLNDDKTVSDRTADALRCLPSRGVRVVIASARPPRSVRHVYRALALDTWQINYNGALIWDEPIQSAVAHSPIPGSLVREIVDSARAMFDEVLVSCEILDRWYTDRADQTYTTETGRLFQPDVIASLDEFCHLDITKLMLLGPPDVVTELESAIGKRFAGRVGIVRTDPDLIQLMDPRASKGVALQKVAVHYGVSAANVLAIGDAPNDVAMLEWAGVAVAMDNAHPSAKAVADWIAPGNNDHGVHAALVRYGLSAG